MKAFRVKGLTDPITDMSGKQSYEIASVAQVHAKLLAADMPAQAATLLAEYEASLQALGANGAVISRTPLRLLQALAEEGHLKTTGDTLKYYALVERLVDAGGDDVLLSDAEKELLVTGTEQMLDLGGLGGAVRTGLMSVLKAAAEEDVT